MMLLAWGLFLNRLLGIIPEVWGALVPKRRKDFARLGLRAMIGGTLAAYMTACIAGLLL
jgi:nucleoside permease NupC